LTGGGESPALKFADGDGTRSQRDGLEHVAAADDAAVGMPISSFFFNHLSVFRGRKHFEIAML
jgi:hypothetical protein